MTHPITIAQALERARGLLAYLVEYRQQCEPNGPGAAQLRNMAVFVKSIEEWVADPSNDPSNAVRRLRDFSKTIERLKVPPDATLEVRGARVQLIESFHLAADQLDATRTAATATPATSSTLDSEAA